MNNIDLLKMFILYFNATIKHSKGLREAYDVKFRVDDDAPGYTFEKNEMINKKLSPSSFLNFNDQKFSLQFISPLSLRELQILKCLSDGKNINQIAQECHIAVVTVNKYISQLKLKTKAKSLFQLGAYYANLFDKFGDLFTSQLIGRRG